MMTFLSHKILRKQLLATALVFSLLPGVVVAQEQQRPVDEEAGNSPKSILFPAGVPSPYFPTDEEIARSANDRLQSGPEQNGRDDPGVTMPFGQDEDVVLEVEEDDPSAYGTLSQRETGLRSTIWRPSDIEKIEKLFEALVLPSTSPAMDEIARKMLLTTASAPTGEVPEEEQSRSFFGDRDREENTRQPFDEDLLKRFINQRLVKLMQRGNLNDLVAFIQNLPEGTLAASKQNAEILMLGGDLNGACQMTVAARNASQARTSQMSRFNMEPNEEEKAEDLFWIRMLAFCRVLEGNGSGAQIALDMLREQGDGDFIFADLLGRLMEDEATRGTFLSRGLTSLEPLNYTILSLLDQEIDADLIENSSPLITSALIINPNMSPENRFQAAVKSYRSGGVTAESLKNIYGLQEFNASEYSSAVRMAEFDDRPIADALLYQAASRQGDYGKTQVLEAIWKRAQERGDMPRKAALNIDTLSSVEPAPELINHAHHVARGLLLGEEKERAFEWYHFARRNAAGGDAEATRALINIWPLALVAADRREIPWSESILTLWWNGQMVLSPENRESKAALFYTIAEAFDYPVSEDKWQELITESRSDKMRAIPIAVWRDLIRAIGENKQGEALTLGLIAMGQDGPGGLEPTGISTIIRMLRSFGMETEARRVAIEALVANDF